MTDPEMKPQRAPEAWLAEMQCDFDLEDILQALLDTDYHLGRAERLLRQRSQE